MPTYMKSVRKMVLNLRTGQPQFIPVYEKVAIEVNSWCEVEFPNGVKVVYRDLNHAEVGRIWMRAWRVAISKNPEAVRWATFARMTGVHRPNPKKKRKGLGAAFSDKLYQHIKLGTLPKERVQRDAILKLASEYVFPK